MRFTALEKDELGYACSHDANQFPPTLAYKALRLVDRTFVHVVTPHLFRYLSPLDFTFDADPEGESVIEQLCRSPYASYVRELHMRPSFNKIKVNEHPILQSRLARWGSIFTLMSVALSNLRILKIQSLHFGGCASFVKDPLGPTFSLPSWFAFPHYSLGLRRYACTSQVKQEEIFSITSIPIHLGNTL